jgi:hypothetical protein
MGLETRGVGNSLGLPILDQVQRGADIPTHVLNQLRRLVPNHHTVGPDRWRRVGAGASGCVIESVTGITSSRSFVARHRDGSLGLVRVGEIRGP